MTPSCTGDEGVFLAGENDDGAVRAAIDLGTVTSRLLVAKVAAQGLSPLLRISHITHMGEGLAASGVISSAAQSRLREAVRDFKARLASFDGSGEAPVRAIATAAMRDASNRDEVAGMLAQEGLALTVITGSREAELSFLGTLSGFAPADLGPPFGFGPKASLHPAAAQHDAPGADWPAAAQHEHPGADRLVMTVDVGGGSTEIIAGLPACDGRIRPQIACSTSLNMGSRRVSDLFLQGDPPTAAEAQAAREWIRGLLSPFLKQLSHNPACVIAVAGSATSAAAIDAGMESYDPCVIHGYRLSHDALARVVERLSAMPLSERRHVAGLEPQRAPVIIGGLLILQALMDELQCETLLISETDILQGVLLDWAYEDA
jgi:exopolyphosphatase/guanosine-5'-triphosphate,3'-diphosphate pyrophosphatase